MVELSKNQESTKTRLREFRKNLSSGEILESFDRVVFESVVEKIIIGGYNEEGVEEPLKITFVYKTGIHSNFNAKDFTPKRKNAAAVHKDAELCSYASDEVKELCLHSSPDTHRMCGGNAKETYLEILYFRQFYRHFVFVEDGEGNRNKRVEKYFGVLAVVEVGCGDKRK